MEWMPCMIALEKCWRWLVVRLLVAAKKSSTKTSRRVVTMAADCRQTKVSLSSSILDVKLCVGSEALVDSRLLMMSLAVSVAAQKNGGDSHHPI